MDIKGICSSCRKCCIGTEIRLIPDDIERWKKENRLDILLNIDSLFGESRQLMQKDNNEECIFLNKNGSCDIHETNPYICKRFPISLKQAKLFECKLIGMIDLK